MEFSGDQVLASAARFLIDGGEEDAASVLLSCNLSVWESGDTWHNGDEVTSAVHVDLTGPRAERWWGSRPRSCPSMCCKPSKRSLEHRRTRAKRRDMMPRCC